MNKPESSNKRRETLTKKFGSWEVYLEAMRQAGRRGGQTSTGGGFKDPSVASQAGFKSAIVRRKMRDDKIK